MKRHQSPRDAAQEKLKKDLHRHTWHCDWLKGSFFFFCECGARAIKAPGNKAHVTY